MQPPKCKASKRFDLKCKDGNFHTMAKYYPFNTGFSKAAVGDNTKILKCKPFTTAPSCSFRMNTNRFSRFFWQVTLPPRVYGRVIPSPCLTMCAQSFSTVKSMEPQDFQVLLSKKENDMASTIIEKILQDSNLQNMKEKIQIVDVREPNELERTRFDDDFNRILNLPLSQRCVYILREL